MKVIKCLYCEAPATVYVPNPEGRMPYCSREHAIEHMNESFAAGRYWRVAYEEGTGEPEVLPINP